MPKKTTQKRNNNKQSKQSNKKENRQTNLKQNISNKNPTQNKQNIIKKTEKTAAGFRGTEPP